MNSRILLTGATGFIGSAVADIRRGDVAENAKQHLKHYIDISDLAAAIVEIIEHRKADGRSC